MGKAIEQARKNLREGFQSDPRWHADAVVQFGVRKVIVGDSRTFAGVADFMRSHGAKLIDLDLQECAEMMTNFIAEHPQLWDEDIGR